jgi:hypothetical protein
VRRENPATRQTTRRNDDVHDVRRNIRPVARVEINPVRAVARQVGTAWREQDPVLRDEFLAIAALVDAHRDEYDAYLAGLGGATHLDEARHARRLRQARGR